MSSPSFAVQGFAPGDAHQCPSLAEQRRVANYRLDGGSRYRYWRGEDPVSLHRAYYGASQQVEQGMRERGGPMACADQLLIFARGLQAARQDTIDPSLRCGWCSGHLPPFAAADL